MMILSKKLQYNIHRLCNILTFEVKLLAGFFQTKLYSILI